MNPVRKSIRQVILAIVTLYQRTLSPDHGALKVFFPFGLCRFYPSCSEYTKQSIERYGVMKGISFGLMQLSHCHPFYNSKGKSQNAKVQVKSDKVSETTFEF